MGTRGEERLKAITDAATEVVAERGYYGMTIQEVSDRVGITQAGLLKYVKNKNGLLMLVLLAACRRPAPVPRPVEPSRPAVKTSAPAPIERLTRACQRSVAQSDLRSSRPFHSQSRPPTGSAVPRKVLSTSLSLLQGDERSAYP